MRRKVSLLRVASKGPTRVLRLCCTVVILTTFICAQVTGCAVKVSSYPDQNIRSLPKSAELDNLHIAVQPLTNIDEQKKYFGTNLSVKGILPVFIIAENRNASKSFVVNSDLITLQEKADKSSFARAVHTDAADTESGYTVLILSVVFVSWLLLYIGNKMFADATVVHHCLVDKAFYTHTVSPGKSVSGFVYFKLPETYVGFEKLSLIIPALELGTETIHQFHLAM